MNLQFALNILAILSGIGVLCAGLGFAYAQFTSGSSKAKDDLITTLRESAVAEKERAERLATEKLALDLRYSTQINNLNKEMGKLQGLYEASESSKREYLAILQGRSPEQIKFMADSLAILAEIRIFIKDINVNQNKTTKFQEAVTTATKEGTGNVLRKDV